MAEAHLHVVVGSPRTAEGPMLRTGQYWNLQCRLLAEVDPLSSASQISEVDPTQTGQSQGRSTAPDGGDPNPEIEGGTGTTSIPQEED